ncbi:hypothetical protein NL676_021254 [Syzygium grande]|nr:hypothetical protein NL676_021254 [Syzygium grande]
MENTIVELKLSGAESPPILFVLSSFPAYSMLWSLLLAYVTYSGGFEIDLVTWSASRVRNTSTMSSAFDMASSAFCLRWFERIAKKLKNKREQEKKGMSKEKMHDSRKGVIIWR